jgi:hypothetical protein
MRSTIAGAGRWSLQAAAGGIALNIEGGAMARMVKCVTLGGEAEGRDFPPGPGELGEQKRFFGAGAEMPSGYVSPNP